MMIKKKEKEKEWRRLCKLVADESDPRRLSELVDQLIEKLDARRRALRRSKQRTPLGGEE
jgi:methylphosphotriester-DNA--protein-cysteine methyltransferase